MILMNYQITFTFQDLIEQPPGGVDYVSKVQAGSAANNNTEALVAGLTDGITVPVTLRQSETTITNPRIIINE